MNLATSFNEIPKNYQKFRQNYPEELIDYIIKKFELKKDAEILDIGAGTGKASEQFAIRGFKPTLLEPGKKMLDVAKKNLKEYDLKYINEPFETAKLEKYDLIISAQAFQWVKRPEGYKKVYNALIEGGHLAFFWNIVNKEHSEFLTRTKEIYEKHCSEFVKSDIPGIVEEIMYLQIFKDQETKIFERTLEFSRADYSKMIHTYSFVCSLEKDKLKDFTKDFNEFLSTYEEPLKVPYQTILITAKK